MMEETGRAEFEKGLRILWIIWAAMLGSLFIYVFICHQVGEEIRGNMNPEFPIGLLKNILYGAIIVTLLFTHFLRRFMLTGRFSSSDVRPYNPGSISHQPALLAKYTVAVLVSLALCEGIGIYGVVLFFLGADLRTLYIFIAISALSMFFYRPKMEELERLAMTMNREKEDL
jgi:F0F1-type ATP synthase membrane subunit c/vacuolar-type H+-ATPase subunit K